MKRIILNGPAIDNGGSYRDAGSEVDVGDGADQIAAKRAKDMVGRGAAVEIAEAAATGQAKAAK